MLTMRFYIFALKLNSMATPYIVKKLESKVNKAIYGHNLISDGDSVMVGISGGKDSFALLDLLASRRRVLPINFELHACHVQALDMNYRADVKFMKDYCKQHNITFHLKDITVDYDPEDRKPACFICSWKRRKMLFTSTREANCNKLALGHHLDDAIETLLMNMINHSQICSIPPSLSMFNGEIQLIRPLTLCLDKELKKYSLVKEFPDEISRCLYHKETHRTAIREIIDQMEKLNRDTRENIYRSMQNIFDEYIVKKDIK